MVRAKRLGLEVGRPFGWGRRLLVDCLAASDGRGEFRSEETQKLCCGWGSLARPSADGQEFLKWRLGLGNLDSLVRVIVHRVNGSRDRDLSDHARRATNRSGHVLDRRHIHSAGYAKAPARMAGRIHLRPADSNLNWGNRNRLLANRHTQVHRRGEHHRLEQRPRRQADGLGRSDSLMRDSHRGNRCDSRARHGTARNCNKHAADGVRGRGDHERSTELMPSLLLQRSHQQGVR